MIFLDKYANGSYINFSLVNDWEINIVNFKENMDTPFLFIYEENKTMPNLTEFFDKTYSQVEFTSILPLIVMEEKMKYNFF